MKLKLKVGGQPSASQADPSSGATTPAQPTASTGATASRKRKDPPGDGTTAEGGAPSAVPAPPSASGPPLKKPATASTMAGAMAPPRLKIALPGAKAAAAAAGNRDSPLPFSRRVVLRALLRTAREVAQGMCHLHANGIIHGDLKPGNVLLRGCRNDRRGFCALVSDFGLSKVTPGGQAVVAHNWSTVTAQAPETFAGQWLPASDVWSFGILLWQLVAGEDVPYRHLAVHEVAAGVSLGLLVPEWPHDTHPSVLALGHACLSLSPQQRPTFSVIVKALIEIEQCVRNEARASASATNSSEQQ